MLRGSTQAIDQKFLEQELATYFYRKLLAIAQGRIDNCSPNRRRSRDWWTRVKKPILVWELGPVGDLQLVSLHMALQDRRGRFVRETPCVCGLTTTGAADSHPHRALGPGNLRPHFDGAQTKTRNFGGCPEHVCFSRKTLLDARNTSDKLVKGVCPENCFSVGRGGLGGG